jgi:dipeptidyl aminopeptidase/acylaminoacyl peptidase
MRLCCVLLGLLAACGGAPRPGAASPSPILASAPCAIAAYEPTMVALEKGLRSEFEHDGHGDELTTAALRESFPGDEWEAFRVAAAAGACQRITYLSDGLRITGFIVRATPAPASERQPVILAVRGGNRQLGIFDDRVLFLLHRMSRAGFVVVATQLRGADGGEGSDEFGGADVHDVNALVPVVAALPDADPARLYGYGASRGGMELLLAVKAGLPVHAVALRGPLLDLVASRARRPELATKVFEQLIPGYAQDPEGALRARSPLAWPEAIRVPTLILHAVEDWRAAPADSERFVAALRARGIEAVLRLVERDIHQLVLHAREEPREVAAWFDAHGAHPK